MSKVNSTLTAERLRELLNYDSETGIFTWAVRGKGIRCIGAKAGCLTPDGYVIVGIDKDLHMAHRLVWLYIHGVWPNNEIDHKNGNRSDNRLINLRDVTSQVNQENRRAPARAETKSMLLGVSWSVRAKRWMAKICVQRKQIYLGLFDTPEAAHSAYIEAKRRLHEGCTI